MKKFLSILLALAVGFTFTFGSAMSAFAADPTPANTYTKAEAMQLINDNAQKAIDAVNTELTTLNASVDAGGNYEVSLNTTDGTAITVSAKAIKSVLKTYADEIISDINTVKSGKIDALDRAFVDKDAEYATTETGTFDKKYVKFDATYAAATIASKYIDTAASGSSAAAGAAFKQGAGPADVTTAAFKLDCSKAEVKVVKEAALAAIGNIDASIYADTDKDAANNNYTSQEKAQKNIVNAKSYFGTFEAVETVAANMDRVNAMNDFYKPGVTAAATSGTLATSTNSNFTQLINGVECTFYGFASLLKKTEATTNDAKLAYAKTKLIADITAKLAATKNSAVTTAQTEIINQQIKGDKADATVIETQQKAIKAAEDAYNAQLDVLTYRVNNYLIINGAGTELGVKANTITVTATGSSNVYATFTADATGAYAQDWINAIYTGSDIKVTDAAHAVAIVEANADLNKYAETIKASIGIDGDTATDVDTKLAAAIKANYENQSGTGLATAFAVPTVNTVLADRQAELVYCSGGNHAVKVNKKSYDVVEHWLTYMNGSAYDAGQFAAIRTIVADTEKAIYDATTVADAEAAFLAGYEKFDAVPTATEHAAMFLYGGALYTDYTAAVKEINAYVDYKLSMFANTEKDNEIYDATKIKSALEDLLKEAYTADELKEKVTEAKATVDGLKTKADALAKKAELEAAVNALPKTVAVENKAAIQAAYDAISEWNEEYCDAFMANAKVATYKALTGTITAYRDTVKKLEADALSLRLTMLLLIKIQQKH